MIDPTINKVYHIARTLHDENRIDSELWYAILEMKDSHIKEIDLGEPEYFKERDDIKETVFICPLCKEKSIGIGHVYKELRICDNCYCDIKGMQKVNSQTIMA